MANHVITVIDSTDGPSRSPTTRDVIKSQTFEVYAAHRYYFKILK